eukprot:273535_1
MVSLIPLKYPITGCIILGILFLFSVQQVCISPVSDRPRIFYRYFSTIYCMNAWILSCMLISHYQQPDDIQLITTVRLFTAWVIICASIILINLAYRTVEAAYKSRKKSHSVPPLFAKAMKLLLLLHTFVIICCYMLTYTLNNAIYITYYYLFLDILFLGMCITVFIPIIQPIIGLTKIIKSAKKSLLHTNNLNNKMFETKTISKQLSVNIRKHIKQELQLKDTQFIYEQIEIDKNTKKHSSEDTSASPNIIKMLTNSHLTAQQLEEINTAITSEQHDAISLQKLQSAKRSMIFTLIFLTLSFMYTAYDFIIIILTTHFTAILSMHISPWPTVLNYIGHFVFDCTIDLVLIASTYKRSYCCSNIAANSFLYICCPICDPKGKS